jgi:hypothetical protein
VTWVERDVPWNELTVEYCDVTGQMLPRRYWSFEVDGREIRAADPRYEALYARLTGVQRDTTHPPEGSNDELQ